MGIDAGAVVEVEGVVVAPRQGVAVSSVLAQAETAATPMKKSNQNRSWRP
jgi:hypothetical protein